MLLEASEQYDVVNQQFSMLAELFPAPTGGEPNNSEIAKKGITIM
ncbi:hypothetical protein [Paenibacillus eucommiae]|uniref:Uncharacterized protein n=1 Tax=Paenibacillus eucommiae TaxID=1355755 RepID=A0ABS4JBX2_9BACL|nr:hypothetical protein [Paenibacillus eucommiae]MBP1996721.1 hypothetical protein [Paenibacillus eucommiae]